MNRQVKIVTRKGVTRVGVVVGTVFKKEVKGSKHFLRVPPAIAFGFDSILQAKRCGADRIAVTDTETMTTFVAFMETLELKGFRVRRGDGEQIALPFEHWRTKMDDAQKHLHDLKNPPKKEEQRELF